MPRVAVIGLDCLTPQLAFDALAHRMPHLSRLRSHGISAPLESSVPPITVPAWSAMVTSRDPGVLGVYGFRDRADRSYTRRRLASSLDVREPTLWDILGKHRKTSRLIGIPQTYPPKPLRGALVTDCLTPGPDARFTYPDELRAEVQAITGGYVFDVAEHRHQDRDRLLADVHEMTRRRFALARTWAARDDWDFMMLVEMGPDRMHHAFWRYMAKDHPRHEPGHRFETAIADYYAALDGEVGALLDALGEETIVLVVSDHGANTMTGGIALNQWLLERGDLVVRSRPSEVTPFDRLDVDWSKTRAWADGGYVGRIYVNVVGREPEGAVSLEDLPRYVAELRAALEALPGPRGEHLTTRAHAPRDVFQATNGIAPELIVYLDDLAYRALGSVGHPSIYTENNDTGPDDANHARHGVFVMRDGRGFREPGRALSLYDVAPTVLERLGVPVPVAMQGRAVE